MQRLCVGGIFVALAVLVQLPVEAQKPQSDEETLEEAVENVKKAIDLGRKKLQARADYLRNKKNDPVGAEATGRKLKDQEVEKRILEFVQKRLPEEKLLPKLVGSWKHKNSPFTRKFLDDGRVIEFRDDMKNAEGQCEEKTPGVVSVDLDNDYHLEIRMVGVDRLAVLVWGPQQNLFGFGEVVDRLLKEDPKLKAP